VKHWEGAARGAEIGDTLLIRGSLRCVMAQLNLVVRDVDGNTSRIVAAAAACARSPSCGRIFWCPKLAVSGYPPETCCSLPACVCRSAARSIDRTGSARHQP